MFSEIKETREADVIIIGAGPAGLTAAYELQKTSNMFKPVVFEMSDTVGGLSRTVLHNGYRFDIGGHRFFTKIPAVEDMWQEVLGDDLITVQRRSRIFFRGRFFTYPLKVPNAFINLGPVESVRILLSYFKWQLRPRDNEDNFEEWVINRFGGRLYMLFFRTYTEKVWGIHPREICADWAAQRIKNLSLAKAIWNAFSGANNSSSLIEEFKYPRLGPGMMWERVRDLICKRGGAIEMRSEVVAVNHDNIRVNSVDIRCWHKDGRPAEIRRVRGKHFVSSMALSDLIQAFHPAPPRAIRDAAERLRYRDFIIVTLCLDRSDPFPDNWIYIHNPHVRVGRIQNFRAWSEDMVPKPDTCSIGMEYFCNQGDDLWNMSDAELQHLATSELAALGLAEAKDVIDACVIRQLKAYPVYDHDYREALDIVSEWLKQLENFQTVGRNGLHRYNNQDHSMLTAMYAARNILGANLDVWNVNVERSYHEKFLIDRCKTKVPAQAESQQYL